MEKKKQGIVITSLLVVSLALVVIGVSYAFFTYSRQGSKENTITTGALTFIYDEQEAEGNGITLSNAFPMSDDEGKAQSGDNNVFDFQVLANTKGESIAYEVIGKKDDASTLPENVTKIYLTTLSGSEESEVATTVKDGVVTTYDELSDTTIADQKGKTLYQEVIPLNQTGYQKNFRLRMWLSEEANTTTNGSWDYNNKTFTIRINVVANGEGKPIYQDESGANVPELVDGMIPVTYDEENKSWIKADTSSEWYNYNNQEWANAVTVTETNRATYMSAEAGTAISMDDINTMWVWIPRYEYMYINLGDQYAGGTKEQPGEIEINFITKETTSPSSGEYKVHPAFNFGGTELSGIWVGKFETSTLESCTAAEGDINIRCDLTNFTLQIKPNVTSWRGARVSTFFQSIREMQTSKYAIYGFANDTSYDIHMSKNSEWGAVAYLSQSKYGKYGNPDYTGVDKEVAINNCSNYITGIGGDTVSAAETEESCATNTYETLKGQTASTTGNITGVYDMSGGATEYVMGVLVDSSGAPRSGNTNSYNSGFNGSLTDGSKYSSGVDFPEAKYYDLYTSTNPSSNDSSLSATACNGGICYGHALSETARWYQDAAYFVDQMSPWFMRGGNYFNVMSAGPLFFNSIAGYALQSVTSRVILAPRTE